MFATILHVQWANRCPHPSEDIETAMRHLPPGFLEPIEFEEERSPEDIDEFRGDVLEEYRQYAADHEEERVKWLAAVPESLKELNKNIHGPLF